MAESILLQRQTPKLIVVTAFDRDREGSLQPVYGPAEQQSEHRAIRAARAPAGKHAWVNRMVARGRPSIGEYGEPTTLFLGGDVPDME
ncbi:MAG: hypothetical protein E5Y89_15175 [Mesorhizobium sp.]|uniref:hypothetical protein n=1 Tax=Mesorhizobium sp. M4A.F.Ca.ET.050.02.1.1 TaxID=2496754 RepID=UPI000FCAC524|nr:hypothetical protein [Mesorhizobium sp. M4A.F.Ca.ET.050.02.1.1]RUX42242.1 hypothetical protein EOA33_32405 [Mesorhizobium sp. M4A.F.Ca.ET.050.02.1.1]TIL78491.1 MAG: hypothetical protein E5Y89_15175 [Mesorhizobium sp.]